jgi:hypothetical protein
MQRCQSRSGPFGRAATSVLVGMSDPRNVAHKKKVTQEKHHQEAKSGTHAGKEREKRSPAAPATQSAEAAPAPASTNKEGAKAEHDPGDLEKSLAGLSKLKDLEFHSRANIEMLAQLSLTIEEELKQREFAEAIGGLYSAQDSFQSKIAAFIETYQAKCDTLKEPA